MLRIATFLCITFVSFHLGSAQTYQLNTPGSLCRVQASSPAIERQIGCAQDGGPALDLGTFTDINPAGHTLATMELVVYGLCAGDVTFSLNGTTIHMDSAPGGLSCTLCEPIASNPLNPQNYSVTITPAVQAAFVAGGANTLSVSATNSTGPSQCFYGADVTITASATTSSIIPTMSQWGLIILGLLVLSLGAIAIRNGKREVFSTNR